MDRILPSPTVPSRPQREVSRRRVSAYGTVEVENAGAHDSVAVARHEGDGGAGELDEQEGLVEEGCGERGGSEERIHCCVRAGRWCSAWVRLMGE